jgi:hypothetical protein
MMLAFEDMKHIGVLLWKRGVARDTREKLEKWFVEASVSAQSSDLNPQLQLPAVELTASRPSKSAPIYGRCCFGGRDGD